ncbi:MAG: MATE family efflux transporter [Firmicutes bacterium]|nr:MATE family efflux transporter [Bacillota bacterium]
MNQQRLFSSKMLLRLIWPLVIEQFLAVAIGFIDTIMVSSLGEASVSGVSLVDSISILIIQVFSALATGGAVIASQYIGRGEDGNACRSAKQLLYSSFLLSSLLMVLALCFRRFILQTVFGHIEQDVMDAAMVYFLLSAVSYPFLSVFNSCAALYRSVGNSRVSMLVAIIMNVINVIGNAVGIYVLKWGVAGAAASTLLARASGAVIMLVLISKRGQKIFIDNIFKPEFDGAMVKRILRIGIPSGLENGAFQVGKLLVASLVTSFGTASIAANAISGSIASISNIPGAAIGLAMVTVVGQCIGAGDYEQAKHYVRRLMLCTYVAMNTLNLFMVIFVHPLVGAFNLSPEASQTAVQIIYSFAAMSTVFWPAAFTIPNALRAAGDVKYTMYCSMLTMGIFRIGFSYVLGSWLQMGVLGVWFAMYIDWIFRAALFFGRYLSGRWKNKKAI